jgi:hypothetical protein
MTGDWRVLKNRRLRELVFHSDEESDTEFHMSEAVPEPDRDERPRGLQPWDSVRASKVQRARELLRDPGYPPRATLDAIADLLAGQLAGKTSGKPGETPGKPSAPGTTTPPKA